MNKTYSGFPKLKKVDTVDLVWPDMAVVFITSTFLYLAYGTAHHIQPVYCSAL